MDAGYENEVLEAKLAELQKDKITWK